MKKQIHNYIVAAVAVPLMMIACSQQLVESQPSPAPIEILPVIRWGNETTAKFSSDRIPFPIQGDISLPVRSDVDQLLSQLTQGLTANIEPLKPASGAEPRYVAIGGSLTAGYRNGGLYRAGQQTSYPNFIAGQMGLKDFRQPLFSVEQGNGSGYKQLVSAGPIPRYVEVTNNRALVGTGTDPVTYTPYSGRADNLGFPQLGRMNIGKTEVWRLDPILAPGNYEPVYRSYFRRLLPQDDRQFTTPYLDYVLQEKADFYTIELGIDDLVMYLSTGGNAFNMASFGSFDSNPIRGILFSLNYQQKAKGVVATVPNVWKFPYFKLYTVGAIKQRNKNKALFVAWDNRFDVNSPNPQLVEPVRDSDILSPTAAVEALLFTPDKTDLQGLGSDNPLHSRDVLSTEEQTQLAWVSGYNSDVKLQAKEYGFALLDLSAIYERILAGTYVTDDGVKLDPAFPGGNFFSQDGLHPTALGQAAIANEWIKVINQSYKTNIPLMRTRLISGEL